MVAEVAADPLTSKLVLALVGALLGWAIKAIWDRYTVQQRWKRLAPLVLRQLAIAATDCAQAFDTSVLPRAIGKLSAAQVSATELVAAGVGTNEWLSGIERIVDALDAAQIAQTAPSAQAGVALQALRARAAALCDWVRTMR